MIENAPPNPPRTCLACPQDSQWLLERMARLTEAATPDELEAQEQNQETTTTAIPAEKLVREVHTLTSQATLVPSIVNRLPLTHNPGVGSKTGKSNKRLRSECLQEAASTWPHLIRQCPDAVGGRVKFQRRMCDVKRMEQIFAELAHQPETIFGNWNQWTWPTDAPGEATWDNLYEGTSTTYHAHPSMV